MTSTMKAVIFKGKDQIAVEGVKKLLVGMGAPARTVLAIADKIRADLVVTGTHGLTGDQQILLGLRFGGCRTWSCRHYRAPDPSGGSCKVRTPTGSSMTRGVPCWCSVCRRALLVILPAPGTFDHSPRTSEIETEARARRHDGGREVRTPSCGRRRARCRWSARLSSRTTTLLMPPLEEGLNRRSAPIGPRAVVRAQAGPIDCCRTAERWCAGRYKNREP